MSRYMLQEPNDPNLRAQGLRQLYENDDGRKLPSDMLKRVSLLLHALDQAKVVDELDLPTFKLHALRGDLRGFWAVTVRANWRLVFRFKEGNVLDLDFIDYH